jgi:hypothetical protein
VAESVLTRDLAHERSVAIRTLLGRPLIDADDDADAFRLVARHAGWLTEWFESACGWALTVDTTAGYARLAKRSAGAPVVRPLHRTRGSEAAFDRRRYQLLCLVCAELVRHPHTTVGLLAGAVRRDANLDTSRHGERAAFVDALRALLAWGVVRASAGDVDAYLGSERGNALLTADTARLHRLMASATAPSALAADATTDDAVERLLAEPRYGDGPDEVASGDDARHRRARHRLARRLLDQPVAHLDDLGPLGHAHQLALLLADRLVNTGATGARTLGRLSAARLAAEVDAVFARFPSWARGQRDEGGAGRLGREAVELLAAFGLVRLHPDGSVEARPALARYRVGEPVVRAATPSLFDEEVPA